MVILFNVSPRAPEEIPAKISEVLFLESAFAIPSEISPIPVHFFFQINLREFSEIFPEIA